jgi:hypothetical protein
MIGVWIALSTGYIPSFFWCNVAFLLVPYVSVEIADCKVHLCW